MIKLHSYYLSICCCWSMLLQHVYIYISINVYICSTRMQIRSNNFVYKQMLVWIFEIKDLGEPLMVFYVWLEFFFFFLLKKVCLYSMYVYLYIVSIFILKKKTRHIYRQFRVVLITICCYCFFFFFNKATICFLKVICNICFWPKICCLLKCICKNKYKFSFIFNNI